ncbi:MAG: radical SAM family heme chaperone HemW [Bacteroidetes bacterium]|nr:radical SAM family heme chaperone HemW [Bacteroidota bacterium]
MAGIYIHIPFCKKACHYCNFHFSTQTKYIDAFTNSVCKEIELQKNYLAQPIDTLYFGGGTPSLLSEAAFNIIVDKINAVYPLHTNVEFTMEANPDDITPMLVKTWKKAGVNRLSMGIQSFQPHALEWMNRAHTAAQSHQAIEVAQTEGIDNISADLIYGTPHLTEEDLLADLTILNQYQIPHLSCYALTVEEKTALHKMIETKKIAPVNMEHQSRHFEIIADYLEGIGMDHYEISNFSKPGFRSKHNSNYWKGIPYLGLGPSAHSYNLNSRQWNVANNQLYFTSLEKNILPFELEALEVHTKYNEYMMVSLRCQEGFSLQYIIDQFGSSFYEYSSKIAEQMVTKKLLVKTEIGFALSKSAKFFADGIASDFFWIAPNQ